MVIPAGKEKVFSLRWSNSLKTVLQNVRVRIVLTYFSPLLLFFCAWPLNPSLKGSQVSLWAQWSQFNNQTPQRDEQKRSLNSYTTCVIFSWRWSQLHLQSMDCRSSILITAVDLWTKCNPHIHTLYNYSISACVLINYMQLTFGSPLC